MESRRWPRLRWGRPAGVFYASKRDIGINGPGHMGIFECGGVERFTYHYYPTGRSVIGVNSLSWGADGWPVAGPQVTTPLKLPCGGSTGVGQAAGADPERLRVRSGPAGRQVDLGEAGFEVLEVFGIDGRLQASLPGGKGWRTIPAGSLGAGVNFLRARRGAASAEAALIP